MQRLYICKYHNKHLVNYIGIAFKKSSSNLNIYLLSENMVYTL